MDSFWKYRFIVNTMRTPLRPYPRELQALYFEVARSARAIPETIKGDQDSYPLQNPLRSVVDSIFLAGERNRNPRQVNKKQW